MKKKQILTVIILFYSVIVPGCLEGVPKLSTATNNITGETIVSMINKSPSLLVYSGAGMRKPMDELGVLFEQKYGIKVTYNYAGSGHLLNQMEFAQQGDIYIPGAMYDFSIAREKGFIDYNKFAAYHIPVIAVPKGNPANITCLDDLAKPGVRVALGDPEACAIGRLGNKILEKNDIKDAVEDNTIVSGATVNALVAYVSRGEVDAAITWEESVLFAPDETSIIEIPKKDNIIETIPVGTLVFSKNKEYARQFVDFITSDEGGAIFEKYGFVPAAVPFYAS
jgi:molybdate transport system substrate-binding protein